MTFKFALLAATVLATVAPLAQAEPLTNVAQGGTVTISGPGFGNSNGWSNGQLAAPSTITDGVFLPTSTQWNTGTIFWAGGVPDFSDSITITLQQVASISGLHLQGDVNDLYAVSYLDLLGGWHSLATIAPNTNTNWGMGDGYASFGPVTASALRIVATGGDGSYAVSELQAMGTVASSVPEPSSIALLLAGFGVLVPVARRRAR
jgi:PEP-CTERM motif